MLGAGRFILRGAILAAGAFVVLAGAFAASGKKRVSTPRPCQPAGGGMKAPDRFTITRVRSASAIKPKWVLRGSGRFECFLLFDTWREAMDQATFRLEALGATRELVVL